MKYIDPDGRELGYSEDGKTITCDLSNEDELAMAAVIFSQQEQSGDLTACTAIDPNTGSSITFNNSQAMFDMIDDPINLEAVMNLFGQAAGLGFAGADYQLGSASSVAKSLSKTSTFFTAVVFTTDLVQAINDPNPDTITDAVISVIGFAGPEGAVVSVGLTYGKQGIIAGATGMAKFSMSYEKWYINRISQAMFGVDFKR